MGDLKLQKKKTTNQIDMDVCFFQKQITYKNYIFPKSLTSIMEFHKGHALVPSWF